MYTYTYIPAQHLEAMVVLKGEIIYPRGVFQRSRSRLVNFWPTRRVPPSAPVSVPLIQPSLFRERKTRKSAAEFPGKQLHNFRKKSFRFGIRGRSATRGREFQRPLITFKPCCRVVMVGGGGGSPSSSTRFALCHRAKLFKLLLELNYAA